MLELLCRRVCCSSLEEGLEKCKYGEWKSIPFRAVLSMVANHMTSLEVDGKGIWGV